MKTYLVFLTGLLGVGLGACGSAADKRAPSQVKADTTGCSQLLERSHSATTAQGHSMEVNFTGPFSRWCWNVYTTRITLTYRWTEEGRYTDKVGFWMRVDGKDDLRDAKVTCGRDPVSPRRYCEAVVSLSNYVNDLEIAPVRDGVWDTFGIGQNYSFRLP